MLKPIKNGFDQISFCSAPSTSTSPSFSSISSFSSFSYWPNVRLPLLLLLLLLIFLLTYLCHQKSVTGIKSKAVKVSPSDNATRKQEARWRSRLCHSLPGVHSTHLSNQPWLRVRKIEASACSRPLLRVAGTFCWVRWGSWGWWPG